MKREPVKSGNIVSIGFDSQTKTAEVEFNSGGVYTVHDIDAEKHAAWVGADSVGGYFHAHIKGVHKVTKGGSG